ncbi:hypothetical protein STEG23_011183 [Scotinomys teguina]
MSAVMLLPGTNSSLLLVQRTVTRTIVLPETIGKGSRVGHEECTAEETEAKESSSANFPQFLALPHPSQPVHYPADVPPARPMHYPAVSPDTTLLMSPASPAHYPADVPPSQPCTLLMSPQPALCTTLLMSPPANPVHYPADVPPPPALCTTLLMSPQPCALLLMSVHYSAPAASPVHYPADVLFTTA